MRLALLLILLALPLPAYNSASFGAGKALYANIPNSAPYNVVSSTRIDFRIHGYTTGGAKQMLWAHPLLSQCYIAASSTSLSCADFAAAGSPSVAISISGRTDILARWTLDRTSATNPTHKEGRLEIWNADGTGYATTDGYPITSASTQNGSGELVLGATLNDGTEAFTGKLAYFRWYSSALTQRSLPPSHVAGGDLLDCELESVTCTGAFSTLSNLGSVAFPATAAATQLPLNCNGAYDCTVRAGVAVTLDATNNASGTTTYLWQNTAFVPAPGYSSDVRVDFGGGRTTSTAGSVAATFPAFGTYTLSLSTVISGVASSLSWKIGAVPGNAEGVVILPTDVAGDKITFLLGPLLRNGVTEWTHYDYLRSKRGRDFGALYQGLITSYLDTPNTHGTVTATTGSTTLTGSGTQFSTDAVACGGLTPDSVIIWSASGSFRRARYTVSACPTATSITLSAAFAPTGCGAGCAGLQYALIPDAEANAWYSSNNYYDSVLVQYQNYYRTGIDDYLTYARTLGGAWWRLPEIDQGRQLNISLLTGRNTAMKGLMLWALDAANSASTNAVFDWCSAFQLDTFNQWITTHGGDNGDLYPNSGMREPGYAFMYAVDLAKAHYDSTTRSAWLTRMATELTNFWLAFQCHTGNAGGRCTAPLGSYRWTDSNYWGGPAEQPFHTGIALEGAADAHRLTGTAGYLTVLSQWVANQRTGTTGSPGNLALWQNGASDFSGITCRHVFYAQYAVPDTDATGCTTLGGTNCIGVNANGVNGQGCSATGDPQGRTSVEVLRDNRAINNEIISAVGYDYSQSLTAAVKTYGDDIFSATFARDAGTGNDGYFGRADYDSKQYGQSFRSTGSYLATRTGSSIAPSTRTLSVGFNLANVATADRITVTIYSPNGDTAESSACTTSPCAVTADQTQGEAAYVVTYKLGSTVLATGARARAQ